jgi:hypothetical protein
MQLFNHHYIVIKMKNLYIVLALLTLLSMGACKKFLDGPQPEDTIPPDTYFISEIQLTTALRAVYDPLQSNELYRQKFQYIKGWEGEEGFAGRANFNVYLNSNDHNASTPDVFSYWRDLYKGIARANVVIANVNNNLGIDQKFRDQVRGEALFLRGYYYYLLVTSYGGVPLVTEPIESIAVTDKERATDVEIYKQIYSDLTTAEGLVAKITTLGFGGRASKSAARALLARVCLSWAGKPIGDASKYIEARKWAKMVMDDTEAAHTLNPNYSDVFINVAKDLYDIKESIWEVEFSGNGSGTFSGDAGTIGYNNGALQTGLGACPGYMRVSAKLYDLYATGDLRKGWNMQNYSYGKNATTLVETRTYLTVPTTQATKYAVIPAKWRREYETVAGPATNVTNQNFTILRYSDVLLMFAEAENEVNGPTAAAQDAVNLVRRRGYAIGGVKTINITNGGVTNYTTAPTVTITGPGTGGATATAVITAGKVTAVNLALHHVTGLAYGKFTGTPTIAFSGGGGTGATATATLFTNADADMPNNLLKDDFRTYIQNERSRELCLKIPVSLI